jgi:C1A family cysteine protease
MTKSFESALLQSGRSLDLAEQDWLVNDSSAYGCSGGFMNGTYAVEKGQALEADCPYKANDSYTCRAVKAAKASRWAFVGARGRAPTNEELKLAIMQYKVVTVTVAAGLGFSNVGDDGVINSCASRTINHMVNIVGWHSDGRFILANSWGKGWGQGGYGFIAQGCNRLASTVDSALVIVAETGPAPQAFRSR